MVPEGQEIFVFIAGMKYYGEMVGFFKQLFCWQELAEIDRLNERIKQLEEDQEKESEYEAHYNNKYPKTDIFYKGRQVPKTKKNIEIDVRNFYHLNDARLKEIAAEIPTGESHDETALECLKWVMDNITYVGDKTKGYPEFWQFPFETLYYKTGDCEDGAILLANLMQLKGIPYWKIRLNAGAVKGGGHAYLVYFCESLEKWVILDWCYWPNKLQIKDRKEYSTEKNYGSVWFSWNSKYCFSKGLNAEAKEMLK